jgi:hypothetical protein
VEGACGAGSHRLALLRVPLLQLHELKSLNLFQVLCQVLLLLV